MNVIETQKLTKSYGTARGIVDVDMSVHEGEIYGFIGPNGAGKSTTIRTLLGLIHPTSGSATVFGKDITKFGPEIRQEVGYLPSEVFYYDDMRAIDLLKYSASFYAADAKATEARIRELAELFDLDLRKKIDDLSYGNKKKVGIIQGLAHEPKLIILDEPTWVVSLCSLVVVFMSLYPAFTQDIATTRKVFEQFPDVVMVALNISLASFFTIYGFFGYLLGFATLAGAIQAMNLGTGVISKEATGKTADFLLTKPVTGWAVVSVKLGAALVLLLMTNVVFSGVAYGVASVMADEPFEASTFLLMASTLLLVQLFFLALGALFSVTIPRIKSVVAVSLPTVFTSTSSGCSATCWPTTRSASSRRSSSSRPRTSSPSQMIQAQPA